MKRVLISGANSGIGRSTALHLAQAGYDVWAGMRDLAKARKLLDHAVAAGTDKRVRPVVLDVCSTESVRAAVARIEAEDGPIDVLVNNAGIALNAVVEDVDIVQAQAVFDANYWGALRCIQAVLPGMRERQGGMIVNVSSVTGRIAALAQVIYASSKWALECLSENLAQEMAPFGVRVKIIEPGVTRTALLAKHGGHPTPTAYADAYRRMFQFYATGIAANQTGDDVALVIREAIEDESPRLRYPCSFGALEICGRRPQVSDADWIALGACLSDEEYQARFKELFGIDLSPDRVG